MKTYTMPEVKITEVMIEDIITTSNNSLCPYESDRD